MGNASPDNAGDPVNKERTSIINKDVVKNKTCLSNNDDWCVYICRSWGLKYI